MSIEEEFTEVNECQGHRAKWESSVVTAYGYGSTLKGWNVLELDSSSGYVKLLID